MCLLYTLSKELSNVCSHIFRENQKNFGVIHNTEEERGEIINKTLSQPYNESPPAAMKKAIRKRVSADAFSRRAFLSLRIFSCAARLVQRFELSFERLRFGCF